MAPKNVVDPDSVDAMVVAELNNMSIQERDLLYEEIHGVEDKIEETPEFLEEKLIGLQAALVDLPVKYRDIYMEAERTSPAYIKDTAFRLMFLRCEYFDAQRAAIRLARFLEGKTQYFGDDTLGRPLRLSDLNEDDLAFLKSGIIQLIPARDRSGRAIISDFNMDPNFEVKDIDSVIKTIVYILCSAAEDEETQKRGMVGIFYFTAALQTVSRLHERDSQMFSWLPIKVVGGHFCFNDPRLRLVKAILMLVIGKERRVRVRMHEGTHTECQYHLMTFGVPVNVFPVTYEGDLKTTNHAKWIARRKVKEDSLLRNGFFEGIDLPRPKDVLLGRGKTVQDHCGNVSMRALVVSYMGEYKRAAKLEKGRIALKVVQDTYRIGGRFLKREKNGWWVVVSDEAAREKISMTFRTSISAFVDHNQHLPSKPRMPAEQQLKRQRSNEPCFCLPFLSTEPKIQTFF